MSFNCSSVMVANAGMPFSRTPFFRNGVRCSPWSSSSTTSDVIRLGPVAPRALGPWQKAQFCSNSGAPRSAAALSGSAPQSQKRACRRGPLRRRHVPVTLLLHAFLPARLGLLAGGHNRGSCGSCHQQRGANRGSHFNSIPGTRGPEHKMDNASSGGHLPPSLKQGLCVPGI